MSVGVWLGDNYLIFAFQERREHNLGGRTTWSYRKGFPASNEDKGQEQKSHRRSYQEIGAGQSGQSDILYVRCIVLYSNCLSYRSLIFSFPIIYIGRFLGRLSGIERATMS